MLTLRKTRQAPQARESAGVGIFLELEPRLLTAECECHTVRVGGVWITSSGVARPKDTPHATAHEPRRPPGARDSLER
jgi:hypothetical protein